MQASCEKSLEKEKEYSSEILTGWESEVKKILDISRRSFGDFLFAVISSGEEAIRNGKKKYKTKQRYEIDRYK